ncbi:MAG: glycogen debranching enzyme N-terminal domain-containing protein [Spirochaetes bacterium]|nr:glycogen debranching enzyme N-terminal domain-containing protein [Spirochaetota bacterium]
MLVLRGSQVQNKDKALLKEWLESNPNGCVSYSTIPCVNIFKEHSLFAYKNSDHITFQLVSCMGETFILNEKPLTSSDYNLERFYIDTHPHFVYNLNGLKVCKSIIIPGHVDVVIIKYEILKESDLSLNLKPVITGRPLHESLKLDKDIRFQLVKEKEYIKYSREDISSVFLSFAGFQFTPESEIIKDDLSDAHRIGEFKAELKVATPVFIGFSKERLKEGLKELYEKEENNRNALIEKYGVKNELHKNIFLSLHSFIKKMGERYRITDSIVFEKNNPGLVLQSLSGIVYPLKQFDIARDIFKFFSKNDIIFQDYPNHTALWYALATYRFIQYTGDWKFIKDELWKSMKEIMEVYHSGELKNITADEYSFLSIKEKAADFAFCGKGCELNILWYNAVRIIELYAAKFTDIKYHTQAQKIIFLLKKNFFKTFYNEEKRYLNHFVDVPPSQKVDSSLRPQQILVISLPFGDLLQPQTKLEIFNHVKEHLFTPEGVRTLSSDHKEFKPSEMSSGALSPFLWGQFISAFLKLNKYSKYARRDAMGMVHKFEKNLKKRLIGYLPEAFTAKEPFDTIGDPSFALSLSEYARVLYEELAKF